MTAGERAQGGPAAAPTEDDTSIENAIHVLAQPLTALSFVLDLASMRSDPEVWRQAIESGRVECKRAIAALQQVRAAAMPGVALVNQDVNRIGGSSW